MNLFETFRHKPCFISVYIPIHVGFLLENPLASYGFNPGRWINQVPNLIIVHGLNLGFHGLVPFLGILAFHSLTVRRRLIFYEFDFIVISHDKTISYRLLTSPTRSTNRALYT